MGTVRVAAIQMRSSTNIADNIEAVDAAVRSAAGEGALYVQTPEMTGIVQKNRPKLFEQIVADEDDPLFKHAASLSAELGIWLHIGSHAIKLGEQLAANRGVLFSPAGTRVATYDKIHMFDVDLGEGQRWKESSVYQPGQTCVVADTVSFLLGLSICYDLRFPQIFRQQAKAGAGVLSCPSVFTKPTGEAHWHTLLKARAIENGAFVIAAAQGGKHEDGRESYGHSLIVDPWGEIVGELDHDAPGILVKDIDLPRVKEARSRIPNLDNERRFAISVTSEKEAIAQTIPVGATK